MTVAELIEYLKTKPQEIQVVYAKYSEQCLMEPDDIEVRDLCKPREDGWVHDSRPDKETQSYLVFPGN